jgi:RNA polymerase sigma-70 factor (ECF subfamily)
MDTFESLRPRLFGIAYRMLGSAMEAEDVVQDAYLRFQSVDPSRIESAEALLRTIVTRLSLDRLRAARVQRETYIGPWLPEPILTADDPTEQIERHEAISTAFLLLLESLTPDERAVFVLHDVFDYDYVEIATILEKTETSCRQILSRAKKHLAAHRPRFTSSPDMHRQFMAQFLQAVQIGELSGLTALLTDDVVAIPDGGGKASAGTHPVLGRDRVGRFILGLQRRYAQLRYSVQIALINGYEGLLISGEDGQVNTVMTFDIDSDGVHGIFITRNPDKFTHVHP